MIDRDHDLPLTRQAAVLNISRGTLYYKPRPASAADLALMRRMDELHLEFPFAGARMLQGLLERTGGGSIGRRSSSCDPIPTLTVIDASWYGWIGCTCPSAEKFNSAGATEASVDYCRQCRHTLCFWNCKPDRILACRGQRLLQTGCPERLTNVVHGSVAGNRMCGNAAPLENR